MELSIDEDGARVGMGSTTNDKAPQCGACAIRGRVGYVTRRPARAEHRLVVMETTGVVRAMEPVKVRGLQCIATMRRAYSKTTLPHKSRKWS